MSEARNGESLLKLEDVTLRVRDRKLLAHTNWEIRRGEQWAVLGPNGSGKSTLARTIAGQLPSAAGRIRLADGERVALVSFEAQAELYAQEIALDHARRFAGRPDSVLTAEGLIAGRPEEERGGASDPAGRPAHHLDIAHLLDRPFRHLSAGEMRKTLIARALASDPTLLVLDEPFDGLDGRSRRSLEHYLESLAAHGRHLILVTHRAEELLGAVSHILMLRDGAVVALGTRGELLETRRLDALYGTQPDAANGRAGARSRFASSGLRTAPAPTLPVHRRDRGADGEPIIVFNGVSVRYGAVTVLDRLTWQVRPGERWGIFGPNGSGKTTILSLIVGDNLQGYANDIELFGGKKGSGESIWEIKQRIGLVTPHLQLAYQRPMSGLEVVLSGLFDTIGLYRRPNEDEVAQARRWLEHLGIASLEERRLNRLSYGQRRLLLIARAMVKEPVLLILDEPCQGLDPPNRRRVLDAIDEACAVEGAALLYVTHHEDERPAGLTHALHLSGSGEPARIETLA